MTCKNDKKNREDARMYARIHGIREITVKYEGAEENIVSRLPDVSTGGMFITTAKMFPEGAVLNLWFRLELTGREVRTRAEVRYCVPGVGVGVEFVGIQTQAVSAILAEIKLAGNARSSND